MKRKIALLMVIMMLFGVNLVAFAEEPGDIWTERMVEALDTQESGRDIETVRSECSFKRDGLFASSNSVNPGEEVAIWMGCTWIYNPDVYEACSYGDYMWSIGGPTCEVLGNTSENTVLKYGDAANTRYLIVGEDETAEELTVIFKCTGWLYFVKEKATGNIFPVTSDEIETLQIVIKVGKEENVSNDTYKNGNTVIIENRLEQTSENTDDNNLQEVEFTNIVKSVNGTTIVSTLNGVYQVTNVAGVAITTPKELVESAVGIVPGEGNAALYVCNNYDQLVGTVLEEAAVLNGKQALTTISLDLYAINKDGQVNKIHNTSSKVRVVIGIPNKYREADKAFTMGIIGIDGTFHILEDLDNDPNTITIETDVFGTMALMTDL